MPASCMLRKTATGRGVGGELRGLASPLRGCGKTLSPSFGKYDSHLTTSAHARTQPQPPGAGPTNPLLPLLCPGSSAPRLSVGNSCPEKAMTHAAQPSRRTAHLPARLPGQSRGSAHSTQAHMVPRLRREQSPRSVSWLRVGSASLVLGTNTSEPVAFLILFHFML